MRTFFLALALIPVAAGTQEMKPREGWRVLPAEKSYETLLADLKAAVPANGLGVVTEAGPTEAAASRDVTIPGNRVVGAFSNDIAVRALALSVPAMIEAPMRFYVTDDGDGTATLSWKTPSLIWAPYLDDAPGLEAIAQELDAHFDAVGAAATK